MILFYHTTNKQKNEDHISIENRSSPSTNEEKKLLLKVRIFVILPFLADVGAVDVDEFDLLTDDSDFSFLSVFTPFSTTPPVFSGSGINVTK